MTVETPLQQEPLGTAGLRKRKKVYAFGESELPEGGDGTITAELDEAKAISAVYVGMNKDTPENGTAWDNSWIHDVFNEVRLVFNDEVFTMDGPTIRYLNILQSHVATDGQFYIPLAYATNRAGVPLGAYPTGKLSVHDIELDLADVTTISDGDDFNTSEEIRVSALMGTRGILDRVTRVKPVTRNLGGTGIQSFTISEAGRMAEVIIEEDGASLNDVLVEVVKESGDEEILDKSLTEVRQENIRQARTSSLPSGWYRLPLEEVVDFQQNDVSHVRFEFDVASSGDIVLHEFLHRDPTGGPLSMGV